MAFPTDDMIKKLVRGSNYLSDVAGSSQLF